MSKDNKQIKAELNSIKSKAKEFLKKNAEIWLKSYKQGIKKYDIFPTKDAKYYISDRGEIMLFHAETDICIEIMKKETFLELYGDWFNGPMGYDESFPLPNDFVPEKKAE